MPVGVVDVGSNTVRVLVSEHGQTLFSEREMLRLGADIERDGWIHEEKLELAASVVARFAADARAVGATAVDVLIASPGRQAANGDELARMISARSECPTRILSATEEAHLAFVGALSVAGPPAGRLVGVLDVGGGSGQVVIGSRRQGPIWTRSIDIGSQRLTSRMLSSDPPGRAAIGAARAEVERYLESFDPPHPRTMLAVGGSARALKRMSGGRLDRDRFDALLVELAETPAIELSECYGIGEDRARTLPAGAVILSAVEQRVGVPLKVQRGGLREGALLTLAAEQALAA